MVVGKALRGSSSSWPSVARIFSYIPSLLRVSSLNLLGRRLSGTWFKGFYFLLRERFLIPNMSFIKWIFAENYDQHWHSSGPSGLVLFMSLLLTLVLLHLEEAQLIYLVESFKSALDQLHYMDGFGDRISCGFDYGLRIALFKETMRVCQIWKNRMVSGLDSDFVLILCLRPPLLHSSVT